MSANISGYNTSPSSEQGSRKNHWPLKILFLLQSFWKGFLKGKELCQKHFHYLFVNLWKCRLEYTRLHRNSASYLLSDCVQDINRNNMNTVKAAIISFLSPTWTKDLIIKFDQVCECHEFLVVLRDKNISASVLNKSHRAHEHCCCFYKHSGAFAHCKYCEVRTMKQDLTADCRIKVVE